MNNFDTIDITARQSILAYNVFVVMVMDIGKIIGFPRRTFRQGYADLNINFFISAYSYKIDLFQSVFANIDFVSAAFHFKKNNVFKN